jgi:hypothetical protein
LRLIFHISHSSFERIKKKYNDNGLRGFALFGSKGRPAMIPNDVILAVKKKLSTKCNKLQMTYADIESLIIQEISSRSNPLHMYDDINRFTMFRAVKSCAPEVTSPTITNERRVIALCDPYNAVSNTAIALTILAPTEQNPNGRFMMEYMSNNDTCTIIIGNPPRSEKVYMQAGSLEILKLLGRSPSRVTKPGERKQRCIRLLASCNAAGTMISAIHQIKQRTCKKLVLIHIAVIDDCNHYLLICPARPLKAELHKILEMEKLIEEGNIPYVEQELLYGEHTDEFYDEENFTPSEELHDNTTNNIICEEVHDNNTNNIISYENLNNPRDLQEVDCTIADERYPTDVEISTLLFFKVILKDLIVLRDNISKRCIINQVYFH